MCVFFSTAIAHDNISIVIHDPVSDHNRLKISILPTCRVYVRQIIKGSVPSSYIEKYQCVCTSNHAPLPLVGLSKSSHCPIISYRVSSRVLSRNVKKSWLLRLYVSMAKLFQSDSLSSQKFIINMRKYTFDTAERMKQSTELQMYVYTN